jgi:hypothetical protein
MRERGPPDPLPQAACEHRRVRPELAAIVDMQQQARTALERTASWDAHVDAVARLDTLDVRALADVIAPSLVTSYQAWSDEASEPIQAALFEWSHSDPYALGFGFRSCRVGAPEPILGVQMPAIALDGDVFHDCGGFDAKPILGLLFRGRATQFLDLVILKVAEIVHHAVIATAELPAFGAFAKIDPFHIVVEQHDRFPILVYRA